MGGNGVISPRIPNFCNNCRQVVSLMPQPLYPKEEIPQHSLSTRLGTLRAGLVAMEKIKIYLSLPQIKAWFLSHSMHNLDQACPTCNLQSFMMWPLTFSVITIMLNFSIFKVSTLKNLHTKNNDTGIWHYTLRTKRSSWISDLACSLFPVLQVWPWHNADETIAAPSYSQQFQKAQAKKFN